MQIQAASTINTELCTPLATSRTKDRKAGPGPGVFEVWIESGCPFPTPQRRAALLMQRALQPNFIKFLQLINTETNFNS